MFGGLLEFFSFKQQSNFAESLKRFQNREVLAQRCFRKNLRRKKRLMR